jgi:hypothetical protein
MSKKFWIPKLNYYSKRLTSWQERMWREVNYGKPFMGIIDNIAGRKYFEYATFGRSGVQQSNSKLFGMRNEKVSIPITQEMTASCVWNVSNAIPKGDALTTQIDRGNDTYDADSMGTWEAYGYAVAGEHYETITGSFGVMDATTYTDGSSTSRTIKGVVYYEPGGGTYGDDMILSLDTTSISNSDTTWKDITWDDTAGTPRTVSRSVDLTSYTASLNGSTHWRDTSAPYNWADNDLNTDFVLTTS